MDFQIFLKHQLTPHGSNHLSWITDASLIANNTDASKCHTLFEELHIYSTNLTLRTLCKAGAVILLPTDENPEAPAGPALTPVGPTRSGLRVLAPHNCSLSLCLPQSPPGPLRSCVPPAPSPENRTHSDLSLPPGSTAASPVQPLGPDAEESPFTPPSASASRCTQPRGRPVRLRTGHRPPSSLPAPLFPPLLSPGVLGWPSAWSPCFRSSLFVLQLPERCF